MYIRNRWFSGFGLSDQKWENLSETAFQRGFSLLCPFLFGLLERKTRLELATPTLARLCSTNWAISAIFRTLQSFFLIASANIRQKKILCKKNFKKIIFFCYLPLFCGYFVHINPQKSASALAINPCTLRYRVVARAAPRVATSNSFSREPAPFEYPIFANCLDGVLRAGWGIAASGRCVWRNALLIEAYQADKGQRHNASATT